MRSNIPHIGCEASAAHPYWMCSRGLRNVGMIAREAREFLPTICIQIVRRRHIRIAHEARHLVLLKPTPAIVTVEHTQTRAHTLQNFPSV